MKLRRLMISPFAISLWVAAAGMNPSFSAAQEPTKSPVKCVKRAADLKPPRGAPPSLRAEGGRKQEFHKAPRPKPVCPEGEVPELTVAPRGRRFPKGNPLFGPYAQPGPAHPLSREFMRRNLLPFDQVYWKRDGRPKGEPAKPMKGSGDAPCDGMSNSGDCYYYATAGETRTADGGGMTYTIEEPVVDNSGDSGEHSIGQIAVQNDPGNFLDDVEMGWSVSPDQFGDTHPHLFVFHWINMDWNLSCYANSTTPCVWNQYSSTYYPSKDLSELVGQNVYIGWVHYRNAWWGWFNDQWLGSIPDSEWSGAYTKSALIQWYGEVESNNGVPPKIQMGNGEFPSQWTAARMSTLCDVDAEAWVCFYRDQQRSGATRINYYDILNHTSSGEVRYGGPGQ